MNYTLGHLRDDVLQRDLNTLIVQDRRTTALLLAHIAEFDARRLFAPAGHSSMHAYCVGELRLSDDAAFRRIRASRAAREFPILFGALADGRLHLAAVSLLAPHLTKENVEELIEAATHKRKAEIEEFLAMRFGQPELPAKVRMIAVAPPRPASQLVPGRVEDVLPLLASGSKPASPQDGGESKPTGSTNQLAPGRVNGAQGTSEPTLAQRYVVQFTISKAAHDKLQYARALLSHAVAVGDVGQVLERALDALIPQLEKQKVGGLKRQFGGQTAKAPVGTASELASSTSRARPRYIPASIRRAVWERDERQCTFVNANGTRCQARHLLEFDHIEPVARGGKATLEGMRLRCRAHNQYEAERLFGAKFMAGKRKEARRPAAKSVEDRTG